jgi:hypothetical protein
MEQLFTCRICFEDKNTNITLQHINPIGDVSKHQMCGDCYKGMTKHECPYCRCEIIIPKPELTAIDIAAAADSHNLTQTIRNIQNNHYNININRNYNFNRIAAGRDWPDGSPRMFSN